MAPETDEPSHRSSVRYGVRALVDTPAQLAGLRRRLRRLLGERGLREDEREAIVLATVEASSNALNACDVAACHIEVVVSLIADYICVEVRDADERFNGVCLDVPGVVGEDEEHGRGLYLMNAMMESFELVPRSRGTLVRMLRRLEHGERPELPDDHELLAS
jgi:anti-sigma regulatory factor (Ser/Thr protein kinase)